VEITPLIGIGIGILLHNVTTLGNERRFSHTRFEFTSIELRVLKLQYKPKPLPDGREHPNLPPGGS
jgi:hypothetical protein